MLAQYFYKCILQLALVYVSDLELQSDNISLLVNAASEELLDHFSI